jgi:hypothetical protein
MDQPTPKPKPKKKIPRPGRKLSMQEACDRVNKRFAKALEKLGKS